MVGIALDEFHPDRLDYLLCLLHIDEQLCVLLDNVKDLAVEVMMQLNKSLSILVVEEIRFAILLAICLDIGRFFLCLFLRLEQVFYFLICFLNPFALQTQFVRLYRKPTFENFDVVVSCLDLLAQEL